VLIHSFDDFVIGIQNVFPSVFSGIFQFLWDVLQTGFATFFTKKFACKPSTGNTKQFLVQMSHHKQKAGVIVAALGGIGINSVRKVPHWPNDWLVFPKVDGTGQRTGSTDFLEDVFDSQMWT